MENQKKALLLGLSAVFLWSSVASAFKLSLDYLSPAQLLFYATLSSCVALFVCLVVLKKLHLFAHITKQMLIKQASLGLVNPFIYYLVLFGAYDVLPAQEAQALNYTWALTLSYLSVLFLGHKLNRFDVVAGLVCYIGVLVISTRGNLLEMEFSNPYGVFLALLSTLLWAMYWIMNAKNEHDPVLGLFLSFVFALPFIGFYIWVYDSFYVQNLIGLWGAVYVGFFEMGITFVLWLYAMRFTTKTSSVANLIFISPFISLIFIYFLVGEEILVSTLVGLCMIIIGLILQELGKRRVSS